MVAGYYQATLQRDSLFSCMLYRFRVCIGKSTLCASQMSELQSALLLKKQLAELNKNPVEGFSAGLIDDNDIYRWEVLLIGPPDTL